MKKGFAMSTQEPEIENLYPIAPESGVEMVRLIDQDKIITDGLGLLPQPITFHPGDSVLDLACGPGGWSRTIAMQYPETEVVGVDISQTMIGYANNYVKTQKIPNLQYQVMDINQPWKFADASFDVINARTLVGVLNAQKWQHVIAEIMRVITPGGIVILTEPDDPGRSNSLAFERVVRIILDMTHRHGIGHHPLGTHFGMIPMLVAYLCQAGFERVETEAHVINFSINTPAHDAVTDDLKRGFYALRPVISRLGIASLDEFDQLHDAMVNAFASPDFYAVWFWLRVWGKKPGSEMR
jgi:ubiquinone/menaquinone biosynthesis C-methylase UbiE